jgi:hypothetical protein
MSEQIRTVVRTKSYCSRNNFVCHLEQKQMYCQNKSEQGVRTSCYYNLNKTLIARTIYYCRENKFTSYLEQ